RQSGHLGITAKPTQCGDRVPTISAAAPAKLASDLNEGVPQLAASPVDPAIQMAVEIECAAEHFAGVDHRELCRASALAEPAISDQLRTRVMVETHRKAEFAAELVGQRIAIERRRQIHGDDRALVRVDHAANGAAPP